MKLNKLVLATAVSMALAACGGGGGSASSDNAPPAATAPLTVVFAGTAAVGAPLTGNVTVKDSKGAIRTVAIGGNGAYSVDVTGMTGPFVFRAAGFANDRAYTVHSVATSADAAGKINITQLTDLIAANVGGLLAQDYFDQFEKNSNAASATGTAIDAEAAKLKEKLQPILTALGVDAKADLLRTPFTPLSSPIDNALDAIHVSVDPATSVATISTTANTSVITDDLKQKAAAETNAPKLIADNIGTAVTDAPLVKKALNDLAAQFEKGLPTVSALLPLLTPDFLNDDLTGRIYFQGQVTEPILIGGTFTDIEIHQIDYSDPAKITARISANLKAKNGVVLDRLENWYVRKSPTDGVWRVHGNQHVIEVAAYASMSKIVGASGTCYRTGIDFTFLDRDFSNNSTSGVFDHFLVTGPGLPQAGLRYSLNDINSNARKPYVMSSDCAGVVSPMGDDGVARIPDNAVYVVTPYDAANTKLSFGFGSTDGTYSLKVSRRPLTLTETKASTAFPVIAEQTVASMSDYSKLNIDFAASNVNPATVAWVHRIQQTAKGGMYEEETNELPTAAGAISASVQFVGPWTGDTIKARTFSVETPDSYRRRLRTVYNR